MIAALLLATTGVRWMLHTHFGTTIPFFLYVPVIIAVGLYSGFNAGVVALIASLLISHYLWATPERVWRIDFSSFVMIVVWFIVTLLLLATITLLRKAVARQIELAAELNIKARQLEEKSVLLEQSEKRLSVHAENLESMVAERTAKLAESLAELESFSYTVSHDLRSPLRAMQGFSDLLNAEYGSKLDPQGRDYLRRIDQGAQRLDSLIRELLQYSSVGRATVELREVELGPLVNQIVREFPAETGRALEVDLVPPLPAVVGNESALGQALSNLLGNAAKFVAPGSTPKIKIWAEHNNGKVRLHVQDSGIGIPEGALPHIFEPFHRAHEAATYPGTGIGLAVVKRAVERQGGMIGVASNPGEGSDFWIELPAAASFSGRNSA